jgi:hypothetical protein
MGKESENEIVIRKPVAKVYDIKGKLKKNLDYLGGIMDDTRLFGE